MEVPEFEGVHDGWAMVIEMSIMRKFWNSKEPQD
jgi:hypothetical protein